MSLLDGIVDAVASEAGVRSAFEDLRNHGEASLSGLACSAKAMAVAALYRDTGRALLVVVPEQGEAEALLGDLEVCLGEERVQFFPETEVIPYDHRSPHVGLLGERIPALAAMAGGASSIVITTARALAGRLPAPGDFARACFSIRVGDELPLAELTERLVARGFRSERLVEEIGSFAVRGGLIDFYPFGRRSPVRVELFGDEVESIRDRSGHSRRSARSTFFRNGSCFSRKT